MIYLFDTKENKNKKLINDIISFLFIIILLMLLIVVVTKLIYY